MSGARNLFFKAVVCSLIALSLIALVMRVYWPKTEPPSILPPGEGTWQPPAVVQAK